LRSSIREADGATICYLGTPLRYRWMGITPTLWAALVRSAPPDVVHVFGFRDPVTTGTAAWCRLRGVPYVFEPLGMFRPRLRKVLLKRALDASLYRGIAKGAAAVVVASALEGEDLVAGGVAPDRVHVRGNGFPEPYDGVPPRGLREKLGIPPDGPIVLYVGRIASGKGIEYLHEAVRRLSDVHLVLAGPDDRHGTSDLVEQALVETGGRIHVLPPRAEPPLDLYPQASVFVLASAGESFGMVAAEAAAAGTPVVVSDRCGVAASFRAGEALVIPYEQEAVVDAIRRVLTDGALAEGARQRRCRSRAADVLEPRDGRSGGHLPRDRLTHCGEEVLNGRFVTPLTDELARAGAHRSPQLRVVRQLLEGCRSALRV